MLLAVMKLAASLAKKATTLAISSGWAIRPIGIAALSFASNSGLFIVESLIGVATAPGPSLTIVTPFDASYTPAVRVNISTLPWATQ